MDDVARLSLTLECPESKPDCGDDDKIRVKGSLVLFTLSYFNLKAWFDVGKMNQRRRGHGVVSFSGESMIIGGFDLRQTEYWMEVDTQFSTTYQEPLLYKYENYPELFVVQKNFCIDGIPHNATLVN